MICGPQGGSWVSVRNNLASSSLLLTPQIHIWTHPTHKCSHSHINKHEEGGRYTNRHKVFYLLEPGLRVSQLQKDSLLGRLKCFNLGEVSATRRQGLIKLAKRATLVPDRPRDVFSQHSILNTGRRNGGSIQLDMGTWSGEVSREGWRREEAGVDTGMMSHVPPVSSSSQETVNLK